MFGDRKNYLMENFYRKMRVQHQLLMNGTEPEGGKWNFDKENRKKYDGKVPIPPPLNLSNNLGFLQSSIEQSGASYFGNIDWSSVVWPIDRQQALSVLNYFNQYCLPHFGTYEDAMSTKHLYLFHSRLSFAMNAKLLSPKEVIDSAIAHYDMHREVISMAQIEGFVRQILGWREYMRGIYWTKMPNYKLLNYFNHDRKLPTWYWTGKVKMNCMKHCIGASLNHAYAHHIQRLMVIGNFSLLAGIHPDEVDKWYLGVYIDAIEWVEITNTRGMSQYADGGLVATKPYVSSANYIDKMSDYCSGCIYDKNKKVGEGACPFNSLYWNFFNKHESKLKTNPRIGMAYVTWSQMNEDTKKEILNQAKKYLEHIEEL
jgi:deoxyribodipyrimidine photolyase-related protein